MGLVKRLAVRKGKNRLENGIGKQTSCYSFFIAFTSYVNHPEIAHGLSKLCER